MAIKANQVGKRIDRDLKMILDAMADENAQGKVIIIRNGKLAFENGEAYFDITPLDPNL